MGSYIYRCEKIKENIFVMKKFLLLGIATFLSCMATMATPDTLINKVYYNLIDSNLTAIVTHDGALEDGAGYTSKVTVPATVKTKTATYTVVAIADSAFYNCSTVQEVSIGSNIVSLGKDIFVGCDKLATISWKAKSCSDFNVSPLGGISSLTTIEFTKGVKYLPANICYNLELSSVKIETNLEDTLLVGKNALKFKSAESVEWKVPTSVDFTETPFGSVENFAFWTKSDARNNPAAVIPANLCAGLDIETLFVPNNIKAIGANAFKGCRNLKEVKWEAALCADFDVAPFENLEKITFSGTWVQRIPARLCEGAAINSVEILSKKGEPFSIGENAFANCANLKEVIWNAEKCNDFVGASPFPMLDTISFGKDVVNIPAYLCYGQENLKFITIPAKVATIGEKAFVGCKSLLAFDVDVANTSFANIDGVLYGLVEGTPSSLVNCPTGVTAVEIPEGTETIEAGSFDGCDKLATLKVPHSVRYIKEKALHGTLWFANQKDGYIYVDNKLYSYKGTMPEGEKMVVKDGIVTIYNNAFDQHNSYVSLTIPESVTFIGEKAFVGSEKLNDVVWNAVNCEDFNEIPFDNMTTITFGDKVENIPAYLCADTKVANVVLPSTVKTIGVRAFVDCADLNSVVMSEGGNMQIADYAFMNCLNLTSMQLPKDLTKVGPFVFSHCSALETLDLPNTLAEIGEQAFYHCSALKTLNLPASLVTLAPFTLHNCSNLVSVELGENLESLCYNTFTNTKLDTITCYAEIPPFVYGVDGLFDVVVKENEETGVVEMDTVPAEQYDFFTVNTQVCILRVPAESIDEYKAHKSWGKFVNIMPISATSKAPISDANIYAVDGQLFVDGVVDNYKVYDVSGHLVYSGNNSSLNLTKGIYVIVVGDKIQKVVL